MVNGRVTRTLHLPIEQGRKNSTTSTVVVIHLLLTCSLLLTLSINENPLLLLRTIYSLFYRIPSMHTKILFLSCATSFTHTHTVHYISSRLFQTRSLTLDSFLFFSIKTEPNSNIQFCCFYTPLSYSDISLRIRINHPHSSLFDGDQLSIHKLSNLSLLLVVFFKACTSLLFLKQRYY